MWLDVGESLGKMVLSAIASGWFCHFPHVLQFNCVTFLTCDSFCIILIRRGFVKLKASPSKKGNHGCPRHVDVAIPAATDPCSVPDPREPYSQTWPWCYSAKHWTLKSGFKMELCCCNSISYLTQSAASTQARDFLELFSGRAAVSTALRSDPWLLENIYI